MYFDTLGHLAHDTVVTACFIGAAFDTDVLAFLQPRLSRVAFANAFLNCDDAAVNFP